MSHDEAVAYMEDNPPCGTVKACMTPDECFFGNPAFVMAYNIPSEELSLWFLRKIPAVFYTDIVDYFKSRLPNEALVRIVLNDGEYSLIVPKELSVSRTHVEVPAHRPEDGLLVCEIHSHNRMPAFWSSVDDADENDAIVYGVIGDLGSNGETSRFRSFYKGSCVTLEKRDVFMDEEVSDMDAVAVAYEKVVKAVCKNDDFFFTGDVISVEVKRLRKELGFTQPFKGKINNKGFSLNEGKLIIKDKERARKMSDNWEADYRAKKDKKTAAYFELSQIVKAGLESAEAF